MTTDSWGRSSWSWLLKPTGPCPPTLLPLSSGCLWTDTDCGQRQRRQRQAWMSHCCCRTHTNNVQRIKHKSSHAYTKNIIDDFKLSYKQKIEKCIMQNIQARSLWKCLLQVLWGMSLPALHIYRLKFFPFFFAKQIKPSQTDFFEWI